MIPGIGDIATGGGAFAPDLGSSATSGDVYSTTNAKQGGLTVNNGLPTWVMGAAMVGAFVVTGVYLWKK